MESAEVLTMRAMAWQRAKGELQAMLATYQLPSGSLGAGGPEESVKVEAAIRELVTTFIQKLEVNL